MKQFFVMTVLICLSVYAFAQKAPVKGRNLASLHKTVRSQGDTIKKGLYVLKTTDLTITATYIWNNDGGKVGTVPMVRIQDGNETFMVTPTYPYENRWKDEVVNWKGHSRVSELTKTKRLNRLYRKVETELSTMQAVAKK